MKVAELVDLLPRKALRIYDFKDKKDACALSLKRPDMTILVGDKIHCYKVVKGAIKKEIKYYWSDFVSLSEINQFLAAGIGVKNVLA